MLPDLKGFFVSLVVVGVVIGVAVAYGLPWLWRLIKPLLHAVTA